MLIDTTIEIMKAETYTMVETRRPILQSIVWEAIEGI